MKNVPIANEKALVMQSVMGQVRHPTVKELPYRLDCEGHAHMLPNTGAIVYNVKVGDSVYGWAGDHIEPGVTIMNSDHKENDGLNNLVCVGNTATVITGDAKGEKGFVTGTHGGVEHVLCYFPRETLEKMTMLDKVQVRAYGQGMVLEGFEDSVTVMNLDPELYKKMGITAENGVLKVPVAAVVPPFLMGSGIGEPSCYHGDYDIMTQDKDALVKYGLDKLRFGDIVLIEDHDNSFGRGYLKGARTIGVVMHSDCIRMGHGPGVTCLMTAKTPVIEPVLGQTANIADFMGV
ncbi:MAG: DUF4438 domain-containing protein [Clostridia bacterium]|nr:DUF4438 domain-containing protein [Clostridia bacterium]